MKKIIFVILFIICMCTAMPVWASPGNQSSQSATEERIFELDRLQKNVSYMANDLKVYELRHSRVINIYNQIIRLNTEIKAGKIPTDEKTVKLALQELDRVLIRIDLKKVTLYNGVGLKERTAKEEIAETEKLLDGTRTSLDKTMLYYKLEHTTIEKAYALLQQEFIKQHKSRYAGKPEPANEPPKLGYQGWYNLCWISELGAWVGIPQIYLPVLVYPNYNPKNGDGLYYITDEDMEIILQMGYENAFMGMKTKAELAIAYKAELDEMLDELKKNNKESIVNIL